MAGKGIYVYDIDDVCKILKVSRRTIEREISAGRLTAIKVRDCTRITDDALREYLNRCRIEKRKKNVKRALHSGRKKA